MRRPSGCYDGAPPRLRRSCTEASPATSGAAMGDATGANAAMKRHCPVGCCSEACGGRPGTAMELRRARWQRCTEASSAANGYCDGIWEMRRQPVLRWSTIVRRGDAMKHTTAVGGDAMEHGEAGGCELCWRPSMKRRCAADEGARLLLRARRRCFPTASR